MECKWWKITKLRVEYTYIIRKWTLTDDVEDSIVYIEKIFLPLGYGGHKKTLLGNKKIRNTCSTLPVDAKDHYGNLLTPDSLKNITMTIDDDGSKGFDDFSYLYCARCTKNTLPLFLEEKKAFLPKNATIEDFVANWNKISHISTNVPVDLCECFFTKGPRGESEPKC